MDELFEKEKFLKTNFDGHDYYYYVSFLKKMDFSRRNQFLQYLKSDPIRALKTRDIYLLIYAALIEFQTKISYEKYDYIIYPDVSHNKLMEMMTSYIDIFLKSVKAKTKLIELKKCKPRNIIYDKGVYEKRDGEKADEYLEKIKKLDYFSIAKNGGAYRKYFRNFFEVNDEVSIVKLEEATKDKKILLFDDINTTGSTLREMIRKLHAINNKLGFDIYTIIGKCQ